MKNSNLVAAVMVACGAAAGSAWATNFTPSYKGADFGLWGTPSNWTTNTLVPVNGGGNTFDVTINNHSVSYSVAGSNTINSLTMSSGFLLLSSSLGSGGGSLTGSTFLASGAGVSLTDTPTTINSVQFTANNGAHVTIGGATAATAGTANSTNLQASATGANSLATLQSLTTINFSGAHATLYCDPGSTLNATLLTTLNYTNLTNNVEYLYLQTAGAGAQINVPVLGNGSITRAQVFLSGGTINWGSPTTVQRSVVDMTTNGTLDLSSITNADATSFFVHHGYNATVPSLTTYNAIADVMSTQLTALDAGSKLSFPALTTVTVTSNTFHLQASSGAILDMSHVTALNGAAVNTLSVVAEGANSVVDLSSLTSTPYFFFEVNNNGKVVMGGDEGHQNITVDFDAQSLQASGTLDVYVGNSLLTQIPGASSNYTHYHLNTGSRVGDVSFVSNGSDFQFANYNAAVITVPEPGTLGAALGAAILLVKRRRRL